MRRVTSPSAFNTWRLPPARKSCAAWRRCTPFSRTRLKCAARRRSGNIPRRKSRMLMPEFHQRRAFALTVIALGLLLPGCDKKNDAQQAGRPATGPVPVQTGVAARKDVPIDLRAIGNVEPIASVAIKAQVTGELIDVSFTEGQDVKKGDLLFTIQPRLYATQLAQAEANLARDQSQAANAKRELARVEELARKNVASKEELDRARAQAEAS